MIEPYEYPSTHTLERCEHCLGNILTIWDETKCVNCGREPYVDHTPVPLAVEPRWGRRWPDGRE